LKEETKAIKTETKPLELNGKQAVLKKLTEEEQIMLLILILAIGIVITSLAIIVVARRY
jgi:subtilase family serine protease